MPGSSSTQGSLSAGVRPIRAVRGDDLPSQVKQITAREKVNCVIVDDEGELQSIRGEKFMLLV